MWFATLLGDTPSEAGYRMEKPGHDPSCAERTGRVKRERPAPLMSAPAQTFGGVPAPLPTVAAGATPGN